MSDKFEDLKGKVLRDISGLEVGSESVRFICEDGDSFRMHHSNDCCETVDINEIHGDVSDLLGQKILLAEEVEYDNSSPEGVEPPASAESYTWTFYKLATIKGSVTIRWLGESNGYYSEGVSFWKDTP